jgi:hypothetical protein
MITLYKFDREHYALLIAEVKDLQPLDLIKVKSSYWQVNPTKGLAIASSPLYVNPTIISDLLIHYRVKNPSTWQGVYDPSLKGILINNASNNSEKVIAEVIPARLPCLQCYRESGEEKLVKPGGLYPYCQKHYDISPHRSKKRKRQSS